MSSDYYGHSTYPSFGAAPSSAAMRAEFELIEAGFAKLPTITGNANKIIAVNSGGNALEASTTPALGTATATSINKVAITQPATGATITVVDGATLTASASATVSGTNTGDNATNSQYSGLVSNANHSGDVTGSTALTIANKVTMTATAPVAVSGSPTVIAGGAVAISMAPASSGVNGYMTGTYATKLDGIAASATNVTNTNQLTNGAGFITSSGTAAACSGNAATASAVAVGGVTGLGTGVATALAVNVGSAGAPVVNGGALGTPASGNLANCTFPTLNQNTSGTAANLSGTPTLPSGTTLVAPVLGTPASGNLANCTFPTLNQNTTGSAGSLATTNWTITEVGGVLTFKYGGVAKATLDSSGNFKALANVGGYQTL